MEVGGTVLGHEPLVSALCCLTTNATFLFPPNCLCVFLFSLSGHRSPRLLAASVPSFCKWLHASSASMCLRQEERGQGTATSRGHSKNWLEPTRPKLAGDLTSSGPWSLLFTHCNTLVRSHTPQTPGHLWLTIKGQNWVVAQFLEIPTPSPK